jgi:lipoate---protein ligase
MPRIYFSLNSLSAIKDPVRRVRHFSSSSYRYELVSVDTIYDSVSKFVIRSRTTDPFLNLAIEDHLLRTSHVDTHILFTYVNRPCVVIGRNQNPWLEVNLAALKSGVSIGAEEDAAYREEVLLVRRRSGGGTVFHDEGNLNYSFIVPNDKHFTRNRHAEMVVQAIHRTSSKLTLRGEQILSPALKEGIRINDRHDIVMPARAEPGPVVAKGGQTVKVSGSAYKLTRRRALHHGTLLFSSPNLKSIGSYLRSPARGFIDAKGVESVRSPIGNLRFSHTPSIREALRTEIEKSIANVFNETYSEGLLDLTSVGEPDIQNHPEINAGTTELKSKGWKYLQTPNFTFTTHQLPGESFQPSRYPASLPPSTKVVLKAKHGIITHSHISLSDDQDTADAEAQQIRAVLQDRNLHDITSWKQLFAGLDTWVHPSTGNLAAWLSEMFPPIWG